MKRLKKKIKKYIKKVIGKTRFKRNYYYNLLRKSFRTAHRFAYYYEKEPLRENYIFYEASCSSDFNSNPYALFKYLIDNPKYKNMLHVISVNDFKNYKLKKYKNNSRVILVKKNSKKYIKYIESCKYLIVDNTVTNYHIKKEGQIYIGSWHASLFKTLGRHTDRIWETFNISKNLMSVDYFTSPNPFTSKKIFEAYYCQNLYNGYILETGYPRNDLYFNLDREKIRKKLKVHSNKKILLYAPTWRGTTSLSNGNIDIFFEYYDKLKEKFSDEYEVLMKLHNMSKKYITKERKNSVVSYDLDTMEVLSVTDILITDYSGILFDFLPMRKPIILFQFDKEDYLSQRGGQKEFYLDSEKFPIPTCLSINKLITTIKRINSIFKKNKNEFENFVTEYADFTDGKICERVVSTIFENNVEGNLYKLKKKSRKKKILISPGELKNNGVTESFLALLDAIDYDKYDVTVLVRTYNKYRDKQLRINKKANIFYLARVNEYSNKEEYYAVSKYLNTGCKDNIEVLKRFATRTIRRLFPDTTFDYAIDYNGYSPIIALLISLGVKAGSKAIYLHNDLYQDMKLKNHQLHQVFSLYNYFDKLVCVCKESMEANMKDTNTYVRETYQIDCTDKFCHITNLINGKKILDESKRDTTMEDEEGDLKIKIEKANLKKNFYIKKPQKENINFITIGRLSPEKNHESLISAFNKCYQKNKNIRLYIVGEGPLYSKLKRQINDLELEEVIYLVGYTTKPFELLNLCDCFILPSLYEGLGLVVLEALVLKKAVISSDIEGPKKFVQEFGGKLVSPTIEGLYEAMEDYIENGMTVKGINYRDFNKAAIKLFYHNVLNDNGK